MKACEGMTYKSFTAVLAASTWVCAGLAAARASAGEPGGDLGPLPGPMVDLHTMTEQGDRFVASLEDGGLAHLTIDPVMQRSLQATFAARRFPFAAAAVVSVHKGRVLALVGHAKDDPSLDAAALALQPWAPAASVFKVVAAAALLQEARLPVDARVCYHGGISAVLPDNLVDIPLLDRSCAGLPYGIGKSQNAVIAKLVTRHLVPDQLERIATAFGFGRELAFDAPVEASALDVPREPLEFARAAAGFWHSTLSVLHGSLIAATVANRGVMPAAHIIDRAVDRNGVLVAPAKRTATRVLDPAVAERVGRMMLLTTSMGTARRSFRDGRGRPVLSAEVAGKTGTLFYRGRPTDPSLPGAASLPGGTLGYSWFVGYAPADKPAIAFAVLLGNAVSSPVRAHALAQQLVAGYLARESASQLLARR